MTGFFLHKYHNVLSQKVYFLDNNYIDATRENFSTVLSKNQEFHVDFLEHSYIVLKKGMFYQKVHFLVKRALCAALRTSDSDMEDRAADTDFRMRKGRRGCRRVPYAGRFVSTAAVQFPQKI